MSGSIPGELGRLTNLEFLYLGGNQLSGSIPGELGSLTNLRALDLWENQLTGCIPMDLADTDVHDLYELGLPFCGALDVPVIVTPIRSSVALTVSWVPPNDADGQAITAYDLRYIRDDANETVEANWMVVEDAWSGARLLRYVITGLAVDTEYKIQVRAVKTTGGPWSAAATGTTARGAARSFRSAFVDPGSEVEVTVSVDGYGASGEVVEAPPYWFSYVSSTLTDSAVTVDGRRVRFTLSGEKTFTYTVTAASTEGTYWFSGVLINADELEQPVEGSSIILVENVENVLRVHVSRDPETQVRPNAPIPVTVTFSKPVFGFTVQDIDVANGTVSNFTGNDGDTIYTIDVTPNAIGEVTVDIAAGVAEDADGYGNIATHLSLGIPYDDDHDGGISKSEAITAVIDYFAGSITKEQAIGVIILYFSS